MSGINQIPIIDLFAGPGGLSEGFSSVSIDNERVFDINLSIEKDENAHKTLELRSFCRQFNLGELPNEYYKVLQEPSTSKRESKKQELFEKFPKEYQVAKNESWRAELGADSFPPEVIDKRIKESLNNTKNWVLIGGPPCQAYSLAGRSRVGGISKDDHRVYLYKEYLRIIAVHQPAIFVMENVKGLLSAKVNNEKVFNWILRDLHNPALVFNNIKSQKYKIYSLTTKADFENNKPYYKNNRDYLIESEKYGIPQKRHRVILLGIRNDLNVYPGILKLNEKEINLRDVIGDLPKIRSGLNRNLISSDKINGKKKRLYEQINDSNEKWIELVNLFRNEIITWNGFSDKYPTSHILIPNNGIGSEYIETAIKDKKNPLSEWYYDPRLNGICNHISRTHLVQDLKRYMFASMFAKAHNRFPRLHEYEKYGSELLPDHKNAKSGIFADRFRVQLPDRPATTITSHISKDGHYFIHYDPDQCRSLTVREAARIQTFPDNYLFCGSRTSQYHQVGNAVPPYLAYQIAQIVYSLFINIRNI